MVDMSIRFRLDGPWFEPIVKSKHFSIAVRTEPAVGSMQPPATSSNVQRPRSGVDRSPLPDAQVRRENSYTSAAFMSCQRVKFTYY